MQSFLKRSSLAYLLLVIWLNASSNSLGAAPKSRAEFASAAKQLKQGMSEAEVRNALGPPDGIHTKDFGTTSNFTGVVSIWFYGTDSRNGFPSWGRVYFSQEPFVFGKESHPELSVVSGGEGTPPNGFQERELRNLLSVIADIPRIDWRHFDPQPLIVAANALQPLGKTKVTQVINEYLRVSPAMKIENVERICLLFRVLSKLPAKSGFIPPPDIGVFAPPPPVDLQQSPRFPIFMVNDIPLLITSGYITGGKPPDLVEELKWFRESGELRAKPLQPGMLPVDSSTWLKQIRRLPEGEESVSEMEPVLKLQWLRILAHNKALGIALPASRTAEEFDWPRTQQQLNRIAGDSSVFLWDSKKNYYDLEK